VVRRLDEGVVRRRRADAFAVLAQRYSDKEDRAKALRAASAALAPRWRIRLAVAERAAMAARLAAMDAEAARIAKVERVAAMLGKGVVSIRPSAVPLGPAAAQGQRQRTRSVER
jgi:hypothetical protein